MPKTKGKTPTKSNKSVASKVKRQKKAHVKISKNPKIGSTKMMEVLKGQAPKKKSTVVKSAKRNDGKKCSAKKAKALKLEKGKKQAEISPVKQGKKGPIGDKYIRYNDLICANDFYNPAHDELYRDSIDNQADFFDREAQLIHWFKPYTEIIDTSDQYMHRWYKGGMTNIAYNCLDRHVLAGDGENVCFYEDSVYTGKKITWTYQQVMEQSGKVATVLKEKFQIGVGDVVVIYMPMIIESAFAMLACARLGATHSVVFGGFAPKELANRIDDCSPKLIITCSAGIEPNKIIKYAPIIEEALNLCTKDPNAKNIPRLIKQRNELEGTLFESNIDATKYHDYDELVTANTEVAECVPVPSENPLYILYTSGTTGQPKGIVRETGGTCVGLNFCMRSVFNVNKGSVHFAGSDIGWVVGHSFIVYGPLLRGSACVFFEGKPVVPNAGVIWDRVQKYKVTSLYMAPTGVRVIKKEDYEGKWIKKYDTRSIDGFLLVGERCDPDTINWMHRHLPHVKINDTWWQTETGWPITGNLLNTKEFGKIFPTLPGSVTKPVPGYDVRIFDEQNNEVAPGELGKVVIKMPLPPSFMLTLWGNDEAFIEKYLTETPGYYTTGDAGMKDVRGYIHIMTRMDDVINTCGHRISTGRLEEVINDHEEVVESAVIGFDEEIRGECPLAFIILKGEGAKNMSQDQQNALKQQIQSKVRADVGAFARLIGVIIMEKLPKTRSGKILRGTIRKVSNQKEWTMPATIDDVNNMKLIEDATAEWRATLVKK